MELTKDNKQHIDSLSYEQLLDRWRFSPLGDPLFQGETGEYFGSAMRKKKEAIGEAKAVNVSKEIGWDKGGKGYA